MPADLRQRMAIMDAAKWVCLAALLSAEEYRGAWCAAHYHGVRPPEGAPIPQGC